MRRRLGATLTLLALGVASVAGADFKEIYGQGMEALDRRSWSDLARLMQQAIDENPQENRGIRTYGMGFRPYLPHYYLGVARAEQGSCAAALAAWRASESQGVIQKLKEYNDLEARRAACLKPEAEAAAAEIRKAREAARRIAELSQDPLLSALWTKEGLAGEQSEAVKLLDAAAAALDSATSGGSVEGIQEASRLAARAQQELAGISRRAEERRGALQAALENELRSRRRRIGDLTAPARQQLDETNLPGLSRALQQEQTALRQALDAASRAESIRSVAELDRLHLRLSEATAALEAAVDEYRRGDPLRREIETLATKAGSVFARAGQLPAGAGVQVQVSALQEALEAASEVGSVRRVAELQGRRQRLSAATAALAAAIDEFRAGDPLRREIETLAGQGGSVLAQARQLPAGAGAQSQLSALQGALDEAAGAGSVRSLAELGRLRQRLADATAALQRAIDDYRAGTPVRQQIDRLTGEATSILERAGRLPRDAGLQDLVSAVERARDTASDAGSRRSAAELETLRGRLSDSIAALEAGLDAHRRMTDLRQQISTLSRDAGGVVERARQLPRDAGVGRQLSAAQQALAAAAKAGSARSPAELETLRRGLDDTTAALKRAIDKYDRSPPVVPVKPQVPVETGPPRRLLDAVGAYLGGDFERTLELLEPDSFTDKRAKVQAHLFRAAAGHALFRMTGSGDDVLLRAATADVEACRRLDTGLAPDTEAFSPAFLAFYRDGGA